MFDFTLQIFTLKLKNKLILKNIHVEKCVHWNIQDDIFAAVLSNRIVSTLNIHRIISTEPPNKRFSGICDSFASIFDTTFLQRK